jgi:hypothetical protein
LKKIVLIVLLIMLSGCYMGCATMTYTGTDPNGKPFTVKTSRTFFVDQNFSLTTPTNPLMNYSVGTSTQLNPFLAMMMQAAAQGAAVGALAAKAPAGNR